MHRLGWILPALFLLAGPLLHADDFKDRKKGPRHANPDLNYSISAPSADWKESSVRAAGADVAYINGAGVQVVVLAVEPPGPMELSKIVDGELAAQKAFATDFQEVSRESMTILGEPALRVVLRIQVQGQPTEYEYHIFQHGGFVYHVMACGAPAAVAAAREDVRAFVSSFRFLGAAKKAESATSPRPRVIRLGELTLSVHLDATWTDDKFEGQPDHSIWVVHGWGPGHFQLLAEETEDDEATYAASSEHFTGSVVGGYATVATGEAELGARTWRRFEGKGTWSNQPSRVFGATCKHGNIGVRACLYWPEATRTEGKEIFAKILSTIQVESPEAADIGLPDKAAQRRAPDNEPRKDLAKAERVYSLPSGERMTAFAPSPDGERLALAKADTLEVIDLRTKAMRLVPEGAGAAHLAWSADRERLWYASADGAVHGWGAEAKPRDLGRRAVAIACGPAGRLLLVEQVDTARPELGWQAGGPQRLLSIAEDGSGERVLYTTRLSRIDLCGVDARTGDALIADLDAGVLRTGGWRLLRVGAEGKPVEVSASPLGTLTSAAWTSDGRVLCETSPWGADEQVGGHAFLLDPSTGKKEPLSLPQHYRPTFVDAKDRLWFQSWWRPDGTYGLGICRIALSDAKGAQNAPAIGVPIDEDGLWALDTKLVMLLPEQPGPSTVPPDALAKAAEVLAEELGPHVQGGLAFQEDSIERLAPFVSSHSSLFSSHPRAVMACGAYAGEVLRRSLSAEWAPSDGHVDMRALRRGNESPLACAVNPVAEFWGLAYAPDEAAYSRVKAWREALRGRKLFLAVSVGSAEKAIDAEEGPDLVASRKAWEKGDAAAAIEGLAKAMQAHPKSELLRMQGFKEAYVAQRLDLAAKWAEEATSLDPKDSEAWSARGTLAIPGDPDRAIECLRKALELAPTEAGHYLRLGYAYAAKKDSRSAIACFSRVTDDRTVGAEARRQIEALRKQGK